MSKLWPEPSTSSPIVHEDSEGSTAGSSQLVMRQVPSPDVMV